MIELDRGAFLRLGAGGLLVAAATSLIPASAGAAAPTPTPRGDDAAFLSFATVAELGRLLAYDAQMLAWLRSHDDKASPAGLLDPIDLEPAADQLDQFLSTPDFPD